MKYLSFLLVILVVASCKKPDDYPIEPVIDYKRIYSTLNNQGYDQKVTVLLNFTDGDGDLGYKPFGQNDAIFDDPNSQYYNNYVALRYEFKNGIWEPDPTILPLGGRLPYLTPEGKNKAMKGEIACEFDVPLQANQDTFRLEIFIYDRSFHKSNTVTTESIILNTL